MLLRVGVIFGFCMLMAACAWRLDQSRQVAAGGIYKIGTPYQIEEQWYYPREDTKYEGKGIASWYGTKFHGNRTANGEIFDMNLLTAAHPTLPMPVMARVTNLENGKSIIVRINDRGPFAKNREIDLSRKAAEQLGYLDKGTAQVRVQYLRRAPLYSAAGRLLGTTEPERFVVSKPRTPFSRRRVEAAPIGDVVAQTFYGKPVPKKSVLDTINRRYAVQVGVFSSRANAEKLRPRLQKFGAVEIVEVKLNDHTYYRVKLGDADKRADARALLEQIIVAGHSEAIIIEQ